MDSRQSRLPLGLTDQLRTALLENLSDGVYFVDPQRRILYWNRGAERISGFTEQEVLGRRCKDSILNHCDAAGSDLCGTQCPLLATMRDGEPREAHIYLHHKDGHRKPVAVHAAPIRDESGRVIGAVETFQDDTTFDESRRRITELEHSAMVDPVTGVGNRRLGESLLGGWLEQHRRFERPFGVLFADIDFFKRVNDAFGHDVGDEALRVIARTLADSCRPQDQVVRWGGEEFLVLVAEPKPGTLDDVAQRLRVLVEKSRFVAERRHIPLTISIGATTAAPGDTPELIVRRADALLYRAKSGGRNRVALDQR